jgi:hypothetical protein
LKLDFFYALLPIAIWRCPLDRTERDRLITNLMAAGFITAVYGLLQERLGPTRLHNLGYAYNTNIRFSGGHLRAFSTFDQDFGFAPFLMIVILVGLPSALRDQRRTRNRLFLLSLPILILALASTLDRGPWIAVAIGVAYIGVRRYPVLLAPAPLLLVAALYLPGSLTAAAISSTSLNQRTSGWHANLQQVVAHPLGVGIGAIGSAGEKTAAAAGKVGQTVYQPDNYYFKTVEELGVLGLWMLLLFLVSAFTSTDQVAARLPGPDGELGLGVAAVVLAAAFVSTVSTFFEIFPNDLLFWLLLGVAVTLPERVSTT